MGEYADMHVEETLNDWVDSFEDVDNEDVDYRKQPLTFRKWRTPKDKPDSDFALKTADIKEGWQLYGRQWEGRKIEWSYHDADKKLRHLVKWDNHYRVWTIMVKNYTYCGGELREGLGSYETLKRAKDHCTGEEWADVI